MAPICALSETISFLVTITHTFYKNGKIDNKTINMIQTTVDPKEFQLHANKFWENVVLKKEYFVKSV